jgi:hypothetical protein
MVYIHQSYEAVQTYERITTRNERSHYKSAVYLSVWTVRDYKRSIHICQECIYRAGLERRTCAATKDTKHAPSAEPHLWQLPSLPRQQSSQSRLLSQTSQARAPALLLPQLPPLHSQSGYPAITKHTGSLASNLNQTALKGDQLMKKRLKRLHNSHIVNGLYILIFVASCLTYITYALPFLAEWYQNLGI